MDGAQGKGQAVGVAQMQDLPGSGILRGAAVQKSKMIPNRPLRFERVELEEVIALQGGPNMGLALVSAGGQAQVGALEVSFQVGQAGL